MKNKFFNILFLFVTVLGFANPIPFGTKLILTKIDGKLINQATVQITIDNENHTISGNSGCNNFSLNYTLKKNKTCIKTDLPIGTLMACDQASMRLETDFLNIIKNRKISVKTKKNKVQLKNWIGKTIMEFEIQKTQTS